jgi:hypothetical protein
MEKPHPYLRPGLSVHALQRIQMARSDTDAAPTMQHAKAALFDQLRTSA